MAAGRRVRKIAISIDPAVLRSIQHAAATEGISVSAWMTNAARQALRVRDGLAAVADWEAEHGELTEAELAAARARVAIE